MASAVEGLHTTAALLSGICWAPFKHAGGAATGRQSPCIALLLGVQVFRQKLCLILKLSVMTVTWTSIFFLNVLLWGTRPIQGQMQVKTKESTHWLVRRQHFNVDLLSRRGLGVLDGDTLVSLEQWRCLTCLHCRDRLSSVSRSHGDRTAQDHWRSLHQEFLFLSRLLMWHFGYYMHYYSNLNWGGHNWFSEAVIANASDISSLLIKTFTEAVGKPPQLIL